MMVTGCSIIMNIEYYVNVYWARPRRGLTLPHLLWLEKAGIFSNCFINLVLMSIKS